MASIPSHPKEYTVYRPVDGKVTATNTPIPTLGPHDVLIKITHTGICFTDHEFFHFGSPLAMGHEGVGTVVAVGSSVTQFQPGDRAAGGYHRGSCGHCNYCLSGNDIWCYERSIYGENDFNNGTFGEYYVGRETYVHRVPEGLSSEHAAPLQCAGATVYSALVNTVKSSDRVGILGIGGLGHLAIQFAAKMGAEVVVFSSSANKEEEAKQFGAKEFYLLDQLDKVKAPVNVLIVSGSRYPDWEKFFEKSVLARKGIIVPLSAPTGGPLTLPSWGLFFNGYEIHTTLVANRKTHDDMLDFAARHGVKPTIQLFEHSAEGITEAFEKLQQNKVRYRAVMAAKQ